MAAADAGRTTTELPLRDLPLLIVHSNNNANNNDDAEDDSGENEVPDDTTYPIPLPSQHLPEELQTCAMFGLDVSNEYHQTILDSALLEYEGDKCYGHVVIIDTNQNKQPPPPQSDDDENDSYEKVLVGQVGCSAKILHKQDGDSNSNCLYFCQGYRRFRIVRLKQTIPFVIATIQELDYDSDSDDSDSDSSMEALDDHTSSHQDDFSSALDNDEDNEDDEDDSEEEDDDEDSLSSEIQKLTPDKLLAQTLQIMETSVQQQLDNVQNKQKLTVLEQSILHDAGMLSQHQLLQQANLYSMEEKMANYQVFKSWIQSEISANSSLQYYATAFMAAELCPLTNPQRQTLLKLEGTDHNVNRLQWACHYAQQAVALTQARNVATEIVDTTTESARDLQVATTNTIDRNWAMKRIRKGTKIEYFWNEDYEWCRGTVVEDPVWIVDELIVTVHFDDDDSTRKLPFSADDKARWRPG